MKVELLDEFLGQLKDQTEYIAQDKPSAARKFKGNILKQIKTLGETPYTHRRSIFFEDERFRDMVFKGYKVIFKIDQEQDTIFVIGLVNMQKGLK